VYLFGPLHAYFSSPCRSRHRLVSSCSVNIARASRSFWRSSVTISTCSAARARSSLPGSAGRRHTLVSSGQITRRVPFATWTRQSPGRPGTRSPPAASASPPTTSPQRQAPVPNTFTDSRPSAPASGRRSASFCVCSRARARRRFARRARGQRRPVARDRIDSGAQVLTDRAALPFGGPRRHRVPPGTSAPTRLAPGSAGTRPAATSPLWSLEADP
jgi:hypothetical protein